MNFGCTALIGIAVACASPCRAQEPLEVKFTIEWGDDGNGNGNGNGILEPGEIAKGKVYAAYSPKGTPTKFDYNGKTYDGIIEGWNISVNLGIYSTKNGETGTSVPVATPPLEYPGAWQTNGYNWWQMTFAQAPPPSNKNYVYDNPIWEFSLLWSTKDYTPRYIEYFVDASLENSHSLHASTPELPFWVKVKAKGFDSAPNGFWIAPAPSVCAAWGVSLIMLGRRRPRPSL